MNFEDPFLHLFRVTRPALLLAPTSFIDNIRARLDAAGVVDAVTNRDSATIFDWMMPLVGLQGISDQAAFAFAEKHGNVRWVDIARGLAARPSCPKLRSSWAFSECGFTKSAHSCANPRHLPTCPLPTHPLRKGSLNRAAFSLWLFVRDVCDGDLVGWIDERLRAADPGVGAPRRASLMRAALLNPLSNVEGFGLKLWSMILSDLLLAGDRDRERWVTTGASFVAVDTVVHNVLHRTGALGRFHASHAYGAACYAPGSCADIIAGLSAQIDARQFNPDFPRRFDRFVEVAIWHFAAGWGANICNGNKIDDRQRCGQSFCPAFAWCDRVVPGLSSR